MLIYTHDRILECFSGFYLRTRFKVYMRLYPVKVPIPLSKKLPVYEIDMRMQIYIYIIIISKLVGALL